MKTTTLALALLLTGCKFEIDHQIPENIDITSGPIIIYFCVDGWLWGQNGGAILNQLGQQETCSEMAN